MNLEKQTYSEYRAMNPDNPTTGERFVMRDHAIFDMQADAFIGAGDACYLLNQHPTTGEWTAETVDRMFPRGGAKGIADAHNAELVAEREYARNAGFNEGVVHEIGRTVEAQQQLAAAVEAAYKEGRGDAYDSVAATDEYNEERWQKSKAKAALTKL